MIPLYTNTVHTYCIVPQFLLLSIDVLVNDIAEVFLAHGFTFATLPSLFHLCPQSHALVATLHRASANLSST